jgi:hypothetical protein
MLAPTTSRGDSYGAPRSAAPGAARRGGIRATNGRTGARVARRAAEDLMKRKPIDSTTLDSVGYEAESGTLEVEFKNGRLYRYHGVPELVYRQLLAADSAGRFLNTRIKPMYEFTQIA